MTVLEHGAFCAMRVYCSAQLSKLCTVRMRGLQPGVDLHAMWYSRRLNKLSFLWVRHIRAYWPLQDQLLWVLLKTFVIGDM